MFYSLLCCLLIDLITFLYINQNVFVEVLLYIDLDIPGLCFAGYGRVAPLSEAGKGFCLLYAMIGIPLTLIFFTAIVERLMIPTKMFLYFLFRKLGHLYRVFHIQLLHFFIMLVAAVIFIFIIPASIYSALEPTWDFLDSFYYCFISMTTIGLGDYIPGDNQDQKARAVYKLATTGRETTQKSLLLIVNLLFTGDLCIILVLEHIQYTISCCLIDI